MQPRALSLFCLSLVLLSMRTDSALALDAARCPEERSWQWVCKTTRDASDDPCAVASQLEDICTPGNILLPLGPQGIYEGPTPAKQTSCTCSTVVYSLVSACAMCQNGSTIKYSHCQKQSTNFDTTLRWSEWSTSCSNTTDSSSPTTLPGGVDVPPWAYIDVKAKDNFDVDEAHRNATDGRNSSIEHPLQPPTNATYISSITQPSTSPQPLQPATGVPSPASGTSKTPKLLGGIIGGFVAVTLLAAAFIWWIIRRRRARSAPSALYRASRGFLDNRPGSTQPLRTADFDIKDIGAPTLMSNRDTAFLAFHSVRKENPPRLEI
ncbi:hypothetical protein FPV67DRAFT_1463086 [Lyophyllum atratum]|nr:hypothetical protein FPV67DRAFT_1463086 [Lyophyllum atratum]